MDRIYVRQAVDAGRQTRRRDAWSTCLKCGDGSDWRNEGALDDYSRYPPIRIGFKRAISAAF
jgi:hypothetical protein